MKLTFIASVLGVFAPINGAHASREEESVKPHRFPFDSLIDDRAFETARSSLWNALTQVGMVSITNIQGLNKNDMLTTFQPCISRSEAMQEQILEDGTRRLTFATHSVPGPGGMQQLHHGSDAEKCLAFTKLSNSFREKTAEVTRVFSERLSSLLQSQDVANQQRPLLKTGDGYAFTTFVDVVKNGQHLEHFHSYESNEGTTGDVSSKGGNTIDWHTDQGLFIVFTPAREVATGSALKGLSGGFHVQNEDGIKATVQFDEEDDLIILLGDGVNQYINQVIPEASSGRLHATQHAVAMPSLAKGGSRVWYGRMVLPPPSAIHPAHGETFGHLQELLVSQNGASDKHVLGCSRASGSRQLQTTSCEDGGTILCWHRCMSVEEHNVSEAFCAEQNLDLACVNPRGQLWDNTHGDFYPACIDIETAENATAYPSLPNSPRDEEDCSASAFQAFVAGGDDSYDHTLDLEQNAIFKWSVRDGQVRGRLIYNGLFGFLAIGLPMEGGEKNGMHGCRTIMALPGSEYSAVTGLNLTLDDTMDEYVIDPVDAAFRHWQTPVSSTRQHLTSHSVNHDDCFTEIRFETSHIHDVSFNLTGTDRLIWAANSNDSFVGYHTARGQMYINWPTGKASINASDFEAEVSATAARSLHLAPAMLVAGTVLGMISIF